MEETKKEISLEYFVFKSFSNNLNKMQLKLQI